MRVICPQEALAPTLRALSRMEKNEVLPLYQSVLLTASSAHESGRGQLSLVGMGMFGTVGMVKQIPAMVEQQGQSLVPINPLAEYVATLYQGDLTLSQAIQERLLTPEQPQDTGLLTLAPRRASPFQIDSAFLSASGRTSTNRARFKAWASEQYPLPPVQEWLAASSEMAPMCSSFLREALAVCAPFARNRKDASEMDGVMVRVEADAMVLTATTGTMLVSHHLPLEHPAPFSFSGLFVGEALSWIGKLLPKQGDVSLALVREEERSVLLISTSQMTLFCRTMADPVPTVWESTLRNPHETELLVERRKLARALIFFASSASEELQALSLSSEGSTLVLEHPPDVDATVQGRRTLQLVKPSPCLHILVNPKQLGRLVRQTTGDTVQLQVGSFERLEGQERKHIGFLRIPCGRSTLMMSLSRERQPIPSGTQEVTPEPEEADHMLTSQSF